MRTILNSYSSQTIIVIVVGGTVALALIWVLVARKLFPHLADGAYEDVVDGLRVVYELVFALILAFVIGSVLGRGNWSLARFTSTAFRGRPMPDRWTIPAASSATRSRRCHGRIGSSSTGSTTHRQPKGSNLSSTARR